MTVHIPPVIHAMICGSLGWGVSLMTPFLAFTGPWRFVPAIILVAAGASLLALALGAFARVQTTINPLAPEQAETLVTSELYRFSRNPMYLAVALILTGGAFLIGNFSAVAAPVLFVWLMTEFQIKPEEQALQEKFGEAFENYRRRTRRWI